MDKDKLKLSILSLIVTQSEVVDVWKNGKPTRESRLMEDDFEIVIDEIVNLLPIHDVSCCDCKKELEDAKGFIKDLQEELSYNTRR